MTEIFNILVVVRLKELKNRILIKRNSKSFVVFTVVQPLYRKF